MLTFNQMYQEALDQVEDDDDTVSLSVIKRGINQGMHKFGAIISREWRLHEVTFSIVANQQYYQLPEDCIRPDTITITVGGIPYVLEEIADSETWGQLNLNTGTSTIPQFYRMKGADQFGIWPIPSAAVASGGAILFEKAMRDMIATDYSTGTVTITNGSSVVTGAGTTFTAAMVGRKLIVDPTTGTGDGRWYTIASYTNATTINLENDYQGINVAGNSFLIGEVADIPPEFHESLIDYGLYRYYRRRKDIGTAKDLKAAFDEQLLLAEQNYSSMSASQYVRARQRPGSNVYSNNPAFNQTRTVT